MADLLIISDDERRAQRLARDLEMFGIIRIHDLYDTALPSSRPSLIVGDVARLTSDALVRLQRCLTAVRNDGQPFLFLVHGNAARAEAQARLLGATETLGATVANWVLIDRLTGLRGHPPLNEGLDIVLRRTRESEVFLKGTFFSGQQITPALADTGTALVADAVREVGIRDWVRAVQCFDDVTHQHILLVAGLSAAFAGSLGLGGADRHRLAKAALLHDVGKTKIPTEILNKPGRLEGAELQIMRSHAMLGHAMLVDCGFEPNLLSVVRSHHEAIDGSGYPDGLEGGQIPDLVRLVTICDIYAALIERRPYKAPMTGANAYSVLEGMGGRLDTDLVRVFQPVASAFDTADISAAA